MKSPLSMVCGLLFMALSAFSVTAAKQPADASITEWVNAAFYEDPRVASASAEVSTLEGIVTLSGSVNNLMQKQYAELEAKKIQGVFGVVNKLIVKPIMRPDIEIRQAIRKRIVNSSVISSESIGVKVENGAVVLTGTVPSYSEKEEAGFLAGEVNGVTSIDNNIMMVFVSKRPDAEISADIKAKIGRDVYLAELPIVVSVEKGVAALSGEVENAYEKDRAAADAAQVSNVSGVKNDLKVRWWEMTGVRPKAPLLSDSALEKSVSKELYVDFRIEHPWSVYVKAKGGHVDLWGTLPTLREKQLALQDAREVVGVAWVSDRLVVKGPWREDLGIEADARFALKSDFALSNDDINLTVSSGSVSLKGSVNTPNERSQAEKDVSRILGVVDVNNNIIIDWQQRYLDEPLRSHIKDRLMDNWETSPIAGKIIVIVKNGAAILTGEVDTWAQYGEASRVATLTQGVRQVENRLSVKGANYQWKNFYTSSPPDALSEPSNTITR